MLRLVINSSPVFLAKIYVFSILAPLVGRRKPLCPVPVLATQEAIAPLSPGDFRFWHKADITTRSINVRFRV
jgi:hypothetical protein